MFSILSRHQNISRFSGHALRIALSVMAAIVIANFGDAKAASTTKSLSTNFTLVNLSGSTANVTVQYLKDDGSAWTADAANTTFTIPGNGGQKIIAQYFDTTLSSGRGSAVISSDQPLGSVAQIQARAPQVPSTDAYVGSSVPSSSYYLPLVIRRGASASGTTNSQIIIQNADSVAVNVNVSLTASTGAPATFNKPIPTLQPGQSYYYDLDDEAGLTTTPWLGSGVVSEGTGKKISVVVNLFLGADGLQTYSGFAASSVGTNWLIPQFTSRLPNGLSTPISGQNLSGGTIAAGAISLNCNSSISTPATFSISNASSVPNNAGFAFNPVTDLSIPNAWSGACSLTSSGNVVVFVQMRQIGTSNNGTYPAVNASSTDKNAFAPLVSKRQANGFATAVTLQNLSATTTANVTLTFTPGATYSGSQTPLVTNTQIAPLANLVLNQRTAGFSVGATLMPDGWFGTLSVTSDQPIGGFTQLTNIQPLVGDTFAAFPIFTTP